MNVRFILESFGIKISDAELQAATDALKNAPRVLSAIVSKVEAFEARLKAIEENLALLASPTDQVEKEYQRQLALFPPQETYANGESKNERRNAND